MDKTVYIDDDFFNFGSNEELKSEVKLVFKSGATFDFKTQLRPIEFAALWKTHGRTLTLLVNGDIIFIRKKDVTFYNVTPIT